MAQYPDDQYNWHNKKRKPHQPFPNFFAFLALIFADRVFVVCHFWKKFPMHLYLYWKSGYALSEMMMKEDMGGIILERLENEEWETGKLISRTDRKERDMQ